MIYDCFTFFNELDLLEIRLNILNDVVDRFVIVEANRTFSNKEKPLYFLDNIDRFEKFKNKIIHIIVDDFPEFEDAWAYERYQRNAIERGLKDCADEDIILISDLDEIPNPKKILKNSKKSGVKVFVQRMYHYHLNFIDKIEPFWFDTSTKMMSFSYFKKNFKYPQIARFSRGRLIFNGGWHFSFISDAGNISNKLKSFSHQEYNNDKYTNELTIQKKIINGEDILLNRERYVYSKVDNSFPSYFFDENFIFSNLFISGKINFYDIITIRFNMLKFSFLAIIKNYILVFFGFSLPISFYKNNKQLYE